MLISWYDTIYSSVIKNIPKMSVVQRGQLWRVAETQLKVNTCITAACAQTLYALCVLHKHELCDDSLHDIFRTVDVAKLMYASNA